MSQELWTAVDRYINLMLVPSDPALETALAESEKAGLPAINVAPNQGKLLHLLARSVLLTRGAAGNNNVGPGSILEIGTLGGYSTIWLARALPPGGRLITLEADPRHAEVARTNIARAGLSHLVELRLGRALDTLPALAGEGHGPFDLIFIDADKPAYAEYFTWAVRLSRPGTLIVADNVVRKGAVAESGTTDPMVQGIRRFHERVAGDSRVNATAIQTVGSKGYDGFALIVVERP
jgi:predicted O-methyltransferase YrrM